MRIAIDAKTLISSWDKNGSEVAASAWIAGIFSADIVVVTSDVGMNTLQGSIAGVSGTCVVVITVEWFVVAASSWIAKIDTANVSIITVDFRRYTLSISRIADSSVASISWAVNDLVLAFTCKAAVDGARILVVAVNSDVHAGSCLIITGSWMAEICGVTLDVSGLASSKATNYSTKILGTQVPIIADNRFYNARSISETANLWTMSVSFNNYKKHTCMDLFEHIHKECIGR